jgi:hypothetical protein
VSEIQKDYVKNTSLQISSTTNYNICSKHRAKTYFVASHFVHRLSNPSKPHTAQLKQPLNRPVPYRSISRARLLSIRSHDVNRRKINSLNENLIAAFEQKHHYLMQYSIVLKCIILWRKHTHDQFTFYYYMSCVIHFKSLVLAAMNHPFYLLSILWIEKFVAIGSNGSTR